MSRVAVIGPGAIGGTVAAWIAQGGAHEVTLFARTPFDRLVVQAPGGTIEAAPRVLTDPLEGKPQDWVLIATKAYDAAATAAWLPRLVGAETRMAVLQNGVEHVARFADYLPASQILPCVVDIPAERSAPGRIVQRRNGTIIVPAGPDGAAFVTLFAGTPIDVSVTDDFTTAAWRKLALNCAGAVNALVLKPAGIAQDDEVAEVMRGLVRECVAVGRAEGAKLDESMADAVVAGYRSADPDSINSLHADRMAGRPMEVDARNGVIVRLGRRHGIAAPLNAAVAAMLSAAAA